MRFRRLAPRAVVVGHSLGAQIVSLVDAGVRVYLAGLLPTGPDRSGTFHSNFGGFLRDELGPQLLARCRHVRGAHVSGLLPRAIGRSVRAPPPPVTARARRRRLCAHDIVLATMQDAAIEPEWQLRKAREAGARIVELETGHSPFFTHPAELTDVLDGLA